MTVYKLVRFYQPFPKNENPYISTRATLTIFSGYLLFPFVSHLTLDRFHSSLRVLITVLHLRGWPSMLRGLRPWAEGIQDRWSVIRPHED